MSFFNKILGRPASDGEHQPLPYTAMPKLTLYHYPSCFFCRRVRNAIASHGFEVELRDIHQDSRWRDDLMGELGRQTVPVLRIEDAEGTVRWMPESRDIVEFLAQLKKL